MTSPAVKVKKSKLTACLTCLLCNNLFTNATTISECLHTFCRECIDKKLIDEKLNNCPVCNADLGCSPLDKLRTDHGLQDLRDKIFPLEVKNAKTAENVPSDRLPTKRKKNSLSSLKAKSKKAKAAERKVSTPQEPIVPAPEPEPGIVADVKEDIKPSGIEILDEVSSILSARRAKAAARRKFIRTELAPTFEPDKVTRDEKKNDDAFGETSKTRVQNSSKSESSQQIASNNISGESAELWKEKADMCEPLNCLVETASKNKSTTNNSTMQEIGVIQVLVDSSDNDSHVPKAKVKKHCHQTEAASDKNESTPPKSDSLKIKWLESTKEKPPKITEDLNLPAQPDNESNKGFGPVWLSLVASDEKEVGALLPQIPSCYLRIKDGSVPVSYIKKYIVKKLGFVSEAEVEILLRAKPVLSSMQLHNLVDLWFQNVPMSERICSSVGSSAKDFVMVLSYCRKA